MSAARRSHHTIGGGCDLPADLIPATSRRYFDGVPVPTIEDRRMLAFGWFGTSIGSTVGRAKSGCGISVASSVGVPAR